MIKMTITSNDVEKGIIMEVDGPKRNVLSELMAGIAHVVVHINTTEEEMAHSLKLISNIAGDPQFFDQICRHKREIEEKPSVS